jgi:hypothetical protein
MSIQLATVLPFLAARLNVDVPDLLAMPAGTVARIFGRHAFLFLDECALNPTRAESLTEAERTAFPAIKEAAQMVGLGAG